MIESVFSITITIIKICFNNYWWSLKRLIAFMIPELVIFYLELVYLYWWTSCCSEPNGRPTASLSICSNIYKLWSIQCTVGHDLDKTPLKPKSTNAFGYWWTSFGYWCMTWNLSLAPFRALKMPKKGLKTTKKCLFGYSEASYVTQIHFFLQCASSYVSWMCIS